MCWDWSHWKIPSHCSSTVICHYLCICYILMWWCKYRAFCHLLPVRAWHYWLSIIDMHILMSRRRFLYSSGWSHLIGALFLDRLWRVQLLSVTHKPPTHRAAWAMMIDMTMLPLFWLWFLKGTFAKSWWAWEHIYHAFGRQFHTLFFIRTPPPFYYLCRRLSIKQSPGLVIKTYGTSHMIDIFILGYFDIGRRWFLPNIELWEYTLI